MPPRLEAERGVIDGKITLLDFGFGCRAQHAGPLTAQGPGRGMMPGIGDRLMPGPDPLVISGGLAVAQHAHPGEISDDLDPAADHGRVDRVVVGIEPDVVVAGQPGGKSPPGRRGDRRQGEHRGLVGGDPLGRGAAQRPARALVHHGQPLRQLDVEVRRATELAAGKERAFQVVMSPLDQPLGFGVGRLADHHPGRQGAAERLALGGQFGPARPPPADRALPVPHQHPRHSTQALDQLPPPGEQILRMPRRDQHPRQPPRVPGHHRQHRQLRRAADLPGPHRHPDRREPQVTLRDLPGHIAGPARRIRRQVDRPQLPDPVLQHRQPSVPPDPLGDHRRRHPRIRRQQLADPRLSRIHDRPPRLAHVLRRPVTTDRRTNRVPRHPQHPGDRLDRQPLRPMQAAYLSPVLHRQHPSSLARISQGHRAGGQNSRADTGSFFRRRRQLGAA